MIRPCQRQGSHSTPQHATMSSRSASILTAPAGENFASVKKFLYLVWTFYTWGELCILADCELLLAQTADPQWRFTLFSKLKLQNLNKAEILTDKILVIVSLKRMYQFVNTLRCLLFFMLTFCSGWSREDIAPFWDGVEFIRRHFSRQMLKRTHSHIVIC